MNTVNTNINIILNREENHLIIHDSLEIEFVVSDNAGSVFANNDNIRLVNCGMMALISTVKLETSGGRTIEYIDHCHPNLLIYKLITSTDDEYESAFVRNQGKRDSQLKDDHIASERGHMYMMVKRWLVMIQKGLNKKNNIDFSYFERKSFYKNVPNATNFLFDLGMESGMERPQYIIVGLKK